MSSTSQATAEIQALAEKLVLAQKELQKAQEATKAVTDSTKFYSTALHAAALVQEQEAAEAAHKAAQALEEYKAAAAGASTSTEELSRLFAKAFGEEVPEKIGDTVKAWQAFRDSSKSSTERAQGLFAAVGLGASAVRAAAVGVVGYAQTLLAMGDAAMQARVHHEQLTEQSNAVAYAMQAARAATGGAATEQDALSVRTALLNANLQTNATAIARVLAFSREHRRAGESNADAANRVVQAIQGNAQAQAELGLRVRAGSTALEAQVQVMRQLEAANRSTNPSQQQAAERQQQLERGFDRAKNGILAFLGEATQLSRIYEGLADGANAVADIQQRLANWWDNGAAAAARQAQEQSREQARQRELLQQQQQAQQVREASIRGIREEISLRTAQSAVESGYAEISAQISATQQVHTQRVAQQAALSRRYNESEEDFLRRQLDGLNGIAGARQQLVQLTQQQEQQRRASDELGVQATTLRNLGLQISSQVRGLSIQQSYNGLLREAAEIRRTELETQTEFEQRAAATLQALEQARQRAIQQAQEAQATREARSSLSRSLGEAVAAGVPGAIVGLGANRVLQVRGSTQQDLDAQTREAPFQLSRRMGESDAAFLNRAAQAIAASAQLFARAAQGEIGIRSAEAARRAAIAEAQNAITNRQRAGQNEVDDAFRAFDGGASQQSLRLVEQQTERSLRMSGGRTYADVTAQIEGLRQLAINERTTAETLRDASGVYSEQGRLHLAAADAATTHAAAIDRARASYFALAQAMSESNDASLQFGIAFAGSREAAERTGFTMADFARTSRGAFDVATGAATQHFNALIEGRETAAQAMAGFGLDLLKGLANYFVGQGVAHGAAALGALAIGNFPGAGLEFAASAGFFAAAGLAGAIGAAATPPQTTASAASSAGASPAASASPSTSREGGTIVYQYNYSGLLELPEAGRTILRAQRAAARNGHTLEG